MTSGMFFTPPPQPLKPSTCHQRNPFQRVTTCSAASCGSCEVCSTLQPHVSVLTLSVRLHPDDAPPLRSDITRSLRVSCDRLTEVKPGDRTRWSEVCRPPSCSKHRESGTRQRVRTTLLIHSGGVAAIFPEVSGHNVCVGDRH